jgi:GR25 family glycosyltransferase involved in LPS biosynthesis
MRLIPFIIYLEQNKARLANVQNLLQTIPGSKIFPAIDGRTVNFLEAKREESKDEKTENKNETFITLGGSIVAHNPIYREKRGLKLGYNEAACLLSHLCLWHHFAETLGENEVGMICEDDAVCDEPVKFVESLNGLPPVTDWDMCQLFTTTKVNKKDDVGTGFHTIHKTAFNRACAYLLTKNGARNIISALPKLTSSAFRMQFPSLDVPADDILSEMYGADRLRVIFPNDKWWNHLERDHGWESSMWSSPNAYKEVIWNKPFNLNWIGVDLGAWTGIGNQMFQYAAAKAQSLRLGMRLVVKPSAQFQLHAFEYIRNWQEFAGSFPRGTRMTLKTRCLIHETEWNKAATWEEKTLGYDPSITELTNLTSTRLKGYLQNIKYFEDMLPVARMIFKFDPEIVDKCKAELEAIRNGLSVDQKDAPFVAVHIRLPNSSDEPLDDVCYSFPTEKFIYDSMDYMLGKYPKAHFILCSNDIARGKTIYDFGNRYISWITLGVFEDMQLMSMCDHFILSSSTFSWWSAVLNDKPEKEVIMCKPFFSRKHNDNLNNYHDLILSDWKTYDMDNSKFI